MKVGYARISTDKQNESLQYDAFKAAGCERVFSDTDTGAEEDRAGLNEALLFLRRGDTLIVWRLDRLARSVKFLLDLMTGFQHKGIEFKSLTEQIDTATPSGKLVFHVFAALAEFERDLIRERTRAGLAAARARGRVGGRPRARALDTASKVAMARALHADKRNSIGEICQTLGVSRSTLYRYIGTDEFDRDSPDMEAVMA